MRDEKKSALLHLQIINENLNKFAKSKKEKKIIKEITNRWTEVISNSNSSLRTLEPKIINNYTKYESYDFEISFDKSKYVFTISWDINQLSKFIEAERLKINSILIENLLISDESINKEDNYIKIENPVIIVSPCILTEYQHQIINGTHRIFEGKKCGTEYIEGYVIHDNLHLKSMLSPLMRDFYLMLEDFKYLAKHINKPFYKKILNDFSCLNINKY